MGRGHRFQSDESGRCVYTNTGCGVLNWKGDISTSDPDDDNDGVPDNADPASWDPDRDGDGIIDGIDPDPWNPSNYVMCEGDSGPLESASFFDEVGSGMDITCAATEKIILEPAARVQAGEVLTLIAPENALAPGTDTIFVENGGTLIIISVDPTAPIPNPPP